MSEWLLTGGSGRLGTELQALREFDAPSHEELDITQPFVKKSYDLVLHAAAYTNVDQAEVNPEPCYETNVGGTARLVETYRNTPFVYISSEHAHHPVNQYCGSKLAAEEVVKAQHPSYLIIRLLFKPRPWLYDNAWADQMTKGDYTDTIAKLTLEAIDEWDKTTCKTINVGTERKSIYELAKQTKSDVRPSSRFDHPGSAARPADYE